FRIVADVDDDVVGGRDVPERDYSIGRGQRDDRRVRRVRVRNLDTAEVDEQRLRRRDLGDGLVHRIVDVQIHAAVGRRDIAERQRALLQVQRAPLNVEVDAVVAFDILDVRAGEVARVERNAQVDALVRIADATAVGDKRDAARVDPRIGSAAEYV